MKIRGKRKAHAAGPLRINRTGLRLTSVTLDLGLWRGVLWQAKPKRRKLMSCDHGESPNSKFAGTTVFGWDAHAIERHMAKCRGAVIFWHSGLLFKVLCCATCGKRVA